MSRLGLIKRRVKWKLMTLSCLLVLFFKLHYDLRLLESISTMQGIRLRSTTYEEDTFHELIKPINHFTKAASTLLIITTNNHLDVTKQCIRSLSVLEDNLDILFIDDASTDKTVEYIKSHKYSIISNNRPHGLTYSWNLGYKLWKKRDYTNLLIANNDILIPKGAITELNKFLMKYPFVTCMSRLKGVGHCPEQSIEYRFNLTKDEIDFVNDPINYQLVQDNLQILFSDNRQTNVHYHVRNRFNGFMFGFRKPDIYKAEYSKGILFDPRNIVVGQEDEVIVRLNHNSIPLTLCKSAFIYHWKSVTIGQSYYLARNNYDAREELSRYHRNLKNNHLQKPTIAFAVSDPKRNPLSGDLFTAKEFAYSLERMLNWNIVYLYRRKNEWYNLTDVDILIVMLDAYNISKIYDNKPTLITIAWMRNWFQRWISWPWFSNYFFVLCSSNRAAKFVQKHKSFNKIQVLRIATSPRRFSKGNSRVNLLYDYVFTGSYWNTNRSIMNFNPQKISKFKGAVYGYGWNQTNNTLQTIWQGFVPYEKIADIYHSTKIVIDDSSLVSIKWGSLNSRVYDALASGVLVLSNDKYGASDIFNATLPIYKDANHLIQLLNYYLNPKNKRVYDTKQKFLRSIVLKSHTYDIRAQEFFRYLRKYLKCNKTNLFDRLCFPFSRISLPICKVRNQEIDLPVNQICVIVRTFSGQRKQLFPMLTSLLAGSNSVKIYIIDTDPLRTSFPTWIDTILSDVNNVYQTCQIYNLHYHINITPKHGYYGYDGTDIAMDFILKNDNCAYIMFTNGDNLYNINLFSIINEATLLGTDIIAWDFITHHVRNGTLNTAIKVKFTRQHVDLGCVLYASKLIKESGVKFLPENGTSDLFARDWHFVESILKSRKGITTKLYHEVLLMHQ
ncbi:unnamed protein product [Rotaria sp. Silwood1]|nr:unnamed protein product [Rotaria sp. Silwood1]